MQKSDAQILVKNYFRNGKIKQKSKIRKKETDLKR